MTEKQMKRFRRWMKERREESGTSWYALGARTGMHPTAVAKIEKTGKDVRMSSFVKICLALDADPVQVLTEMLER